MIIFHHHMNAENNFSQLSAESSTDRMAHMSPEERAEYNDYLDKREGDDTSEYDDDQTPSEDGEPMGSHDLSDDAQALASAGHGMDEDYRPDIADNDFIGGYWGDGY